MDKIKWTEENCLKESKKYTTLKDFINNSKRAYRVSLKNDWISNYTWLKRGRNIWTEESVKNASKTCKTFTEFREKYPAAYEKAKENNWLSNYTWLKKLEYNESETNWLVYVYILGEKYVYVGLTVDIKRRDKEHCTRKNDSLYKFCINNNIELKPGNYTILKENLTAEEARIIEDDKIKYYESLGYIIINTGKTGSKSGSIGSAIYKWDEKSCYNAAKECKTRKEFEKKYFRAYYNSITNKWIDSYDWFISGLDKYKKKVYQYDLDGNYIREFESLHEANRLLNINKGNRDISRVCHGKRKTAYGFRWSFEKYDKLP